MPERWEQIERLYHAALEREPSARAAFLAEGCGGDEELRREVASLLAYDDQPASFIEAPALEVVARELAAESFFAASARPPASAPSQIGVYQILSMLGRGGMGEVWLAHDPRLGRKVAVKLLPAEFTQDAERVRRFEQEARTASSLNHPNIITIYEIGEVEDQRYLVTEYIEGETLRQRIENAPQKRMRLIEALEMAAQIASALEAAHEAGIIHRDIKPENVMVRKDGLVKVLDFGLAKLTERAAAPVDTETPTKRRVSTEAGAVIGTVAYMSPEQARGLKAGHRTDIFSLGVILYEMMAGRRPFEGQTPSDLIAAVLMSDPVPLAQAAPEISAALQRIVMRCLEKQPEKRFQSAGDLSFALGALSSSSDPHAGVTRAALPGAEEVNVAPLPYRRTFWISLLALLLGIASGSSALLWRKPERGFWKIPAAAPRRVLRHAGPVNQAALSPDGNQFVYVYENELYLQSLAGGAPQRLTADGYPKYVPRFSPNGSRLIYARYDKDEKTVALFTLDLPVSIPRLLIEDASKGVWSPDGKQLAFVRHTTQELFVGDNEGRQPHSLGPADTFGFLAGISWSPDGHVLALAHKGRIYLVDAQGGSRKQLAEVRAVDVAYTPDGRFLLVQMGCGSYWCLWQTSIHGGPAVPFASVPYEINGITIDRDGTKVLTAFHKDEVHVAIAVRGGSLASLRQITYGEGEAYPSLSPDERRIAYSDQSPGGGIKIINVDGTEPVEVFIKHPPGALVWSPDGAALAYGDSHNSLWTVRLDEGKPRAVAQMSSSTISLSYSADGQFLVFQLSQNDKSDLWQVPVSGGQAQPLTSDANSLHPRAAPSGDAVAYFRKTSPQTLELRVMDRATKHDFLVADAQAIAAYRPYECAPRWSRDGQYIYLLTETGLLQVKATGGTLVKTDFVFPKLTTTSGYIPTFDVFADGRRMVLGSLAANAEPWLYSDLR